MRADRKEQVTEGYYIGLMEACGYRDKDLEKPVIGIVNSWSDGNPGHKPFKTLVESIKAGVWSAGGTPVEFTVPSPCDAHGQGYGMHYILPQRDLIAASIEAMSNSQGYDGLVFMCSCDKIVPGMLMAAARLNIPCVVVSGGPMLPGRYNGRDISVSQSFEAAGEYAAGNSVCGCVCIHNVGRESL